MIFYVCKLFYSMTVLFSMLKIVYCLNKLKQRKKLNNYYNGIKIKTVLDKKIIKQDSNLFFQINIRAYAHAQGISLVDKS